MKKLFVCLCAALLLMTCAYGEETDVQALLQSMTLREKVGQLFFVRPDALDESMELALVNDSAAEGVTSVTPSVEQGLRDYPVGGVALFGKNLEGEEQMTKLLAGLQGASKVPLLFCIDEEGGIVARIANKGVFDVPKTDPMESIAQTGDPENARTACRNIGTYLHKFGYHLDFAPVADVNTNPLNTVIGSRAFGDDPTLAAEMVRAAVEGFHEAGVACTLKHFPGHGDTAEDTHEGYAATQKTWDEIKGCEMLPFIAGIEAGADAVMVAHISAPQVTGDHVPATLSHTLITEKLREEMGYQGVVITDALNMGAILFEYSAAECCVRALLAGCDVLLMPADLPAAFAGVIEAVESGVVPPERIDESVTRILTLKEKCGLL